jgi:hypothetical protein
VDQRRIELLTSGHLEDGLVAREVDDIDRIVATLYKLTYRSR